MTTDDRRKRSPISTCLVSALLLAACVASFFRSEDSDALAFTAGLNRRQALAAGVLGTATGVAEPAHAMSELYDSQTLKQDQYRGALTELATGLEWFTFFVGDRIATGAEASPENCQNNLCEGAEALQSVRRVITSSRRGPMMAMSQAESSLIGPMTIVSTIGMWDPDESDDARGKVANIQNSIRTLASVIKEDSRDGETAKIAYENTLVRLNDFVRTMNKAVEAAPTDKIYVFELPGMKEQARLRDTARSLKEADDERRQKNVKGNNFIGAAVKNIKDDTVIDTGDSYWLASRVAYEIASDPESVFRDRNAFGDKQLRRTLKQFPGATLLLR
eukprot:TRINITY_DN7953_c0_g1_i1.p1 TRINITY_DN7953_c0_g1~~TRINITY_DN7953_c0_g1_i1.p1  ORF type:complete len:333 (+),score=59.77 TRINITY_DN7953_c0_g1_i1:52-1050(+)